MIIPRARAGAKAEFTLGPWDKGVDEKANPGIVPGNALIAANNVLMDEMPGVAVKRWGNRKIAVLPSGNPPKYGYNFKKNDGTEYLLLSDGAKLYVTTDLVTITELVITSAAGATVVLDNTGYIQFETAESKCWITNGIDFVMWFDGTNLVLMDREFGTAVAAVADSSTGTTIVDASLTAGHGNDWWKFRKVVITASAASGARAGYESTVTGFVEATGTLTFAPEIVGLTGLVTYKVGLIMPKARIIRYGMDTMFLGGTSENRSEIRFNRMDNPDNGSRMSLDNPVAWPTNYQLSITQDDGDQVWTFSPVYRNRILVTKGVAIYRLEPSATHVYEPVLVSQEVGCRYPDSWAVKDNLLHFMGNEQSGILDLYVTDMVSVKPKHQDGRLLPSFDQMYRSQPVYKYIARANADQFDTGEKSTLCETGNGRLECRVIDSKAGWDEITTAQLNAAVSVALDSVTINGIPAWPQKYECNALPTAASPVWTKTAYAYAAESISAGKLVNSYAPVGYIGYYRSNIFNAAKNIFTAFRFKQDPRNLSAQTRILIQNGQKAVFIKATTGSNATLLYIYVNGSTAVNATCTISDYHIFSLGLDNTGRGCVYLDGVLVWADTAPAASTTIDGYVVPSTNCIGYHTYAAFAPNGFYLDYIYEDADFAFTAAQLPATLATAGSVTVKIDYKRAPEAFGKYWITLGYDFSGTASASSATTLIDLALTGEDNFWNGRIVTITSGVRAGDSGTVTGYAATTHTLTISGLAGDPGAATFKINRGGTVAIQSQSSADDITYSALVALVNGAQPSSAVARYLKLTITLTRADVANGPEISALTGGFSWRMKGELTGQIGTNITAWRNYLDEITKPTGTTLVTKIRIAKTLEKPVETDWSAWTTFVTTNNIGTTLSPTDVIPAGGVTAGEGRWIDVKAEGGPSAYGVTPNLENFLLNWQEGSTSRLALTAFIFKKRLYLCGISRTVAANDRIFVLDTLNAWTKFTGQSINRIVTFRGLIYGLSSIDTSIFQQEVEGQYNDDTVAIAANIDTGALDFGHQRFEIAAIKVGSVGIISNVQVLLSYDNITWTTIGTLAFTASGAKILRVPRGRIGKQHFVRLSVPLAEGMKINMLRVAGTYMPEEL